MRPRFQVLKNGYIATSYGASGGKLSPEELYESIGYDVDDLGDQYRNTCAARLSLALLKAGVAFKGRLVIKNGPFKGKFIETGAKTLGDELRKSHVFGEGRYFFGPGRQIKAMDALRNERGVVLFHGAYSHESGGNGGHIDLIEPTLFCGSDCYFSATEIWFWKLEL